MASERQAKGLACLQSPRAEVVHWTRVVRAQWRKCNACQPTILIDEAAQFYTGRQCRFVPFASRARSLFLSYRFVSAARPSQLDLHFIIHIVVELEQPSVANASPVNWWLCNRWRRSSSSSFSAAICCGLFASAVNNRKRSVGPLETSGSDSIGASR